MADVFDVPGAFELAPGRPVRAPARGATPGSICLGAVIRGETSHYDHVCNEAARGIQDVALRTGVPCSFGVLTVESMEQAVARAGGGKRDQGAAAAEAVLALAKIREIFRAGCSSGRAGRGRRSPASRSRLTLRNSMAKVCHSCAKGPAFGNSRSHSMVATRRRFDPNLQKVRILVGKTPRRVYVCTRCLKAGKVTKAA